jgi:hypothetical protein
MFGRVLQPKDFCAKCSEDVDFRSEAVSDRRVKYFQENFKAYCRSEFLKTAEFFCYNPGHNASIEGIFSVMKAQWTDELNWITTKAMQGVRLLQFNLRDYSCLQFN